VGTDGNHFSYIAPSGKSKYVKAEDLEDMEEPLVLFLEDYRWAIHDELHLCQDPLNKTFKPARERSAQQQICRRQGPCRRQHQQKNLLFERRFFAIDWEEKNLPISFSLISCPFCFSPFFSLQLLA